ncbi:MAG: copper amine oxidase N-terminal domain-containing protein [Clostridiales bacterium]|nr:copper amine oxidase N-terminal domain-containing protein [Clostridiales bacterium]
MNKFKKTLCFILAIMLMLTPTSTAFAKNNKKHKQNNKKQEWVQKDNKKIKKKKKKFKMKDTSVIKYGRYKLPINPVTKGMGAKIDYNKKGALLTVEKGNFTIVIDFKNEIITVNGKKDTNSKIFNQKNKNKTIVLIKYLAEIFGMKADIDDDEIIVEVPGLDYPRNIEITPIGTNVKKNTLNSSTKAMIVTASIKAGQATGGRAELYVGSRLVARDKEILAKDKSVTFTTSDGSPTNAELKALVPTGGLVTVRLYNAEGKYVTSKVANPTLVVDYVDPKIKSISSGSIDLTNGQLYIDVTGAGAVGDKVDVTKLVIYDKDLSKNYRLTNSEKTGSSGEVKSENLLLIDLGIKDKLGLANFDSNNMYLMVSKGSLLYDDAGNKSYNFTDDQMIPLNASLSLHAPTNVKVKTHGTNTKENTLNTTTTHITATASIIPGQASGGKAELYVGNKLVATDTNIKASDKTVSFTTSDGTPTNRELKEIIPKGGTVTVRLYNANGNYLVSKAENPTLIVDYVVPKLTSISSATYVPATNKIYLEVAGAGDVGDFVVVTKLSIFDSNLQKSYTLTNDSKTGSSGVVNSSKSLLINIGSADQLKLSSFGKTSMFLTINEGVLLQDKAGNTYTNMAVQVLPLEIVK